ncbi:MAG: hypothetical protein H6605_03750 [Flavobacteriales bacterium]|nr:hypothetical protein [Flavobacteriales bacterium]
MVGRSWSGGTYRYGFNGKEKDDEINVDGGSYDFGVRIYDSRLGKWLAVDPEFRSYPSNSPYTFALDNPIMFEDYEGSKIKFSLALRIFHRDVYKAQLTYLKSESGKEIYGDFATKRQAKKFWGEHNAGSLSGNNDILFKYQKKAGGETNGYVRIGLKWVNADWGLSEDYLIGDGKFIKRIHGNTKGKVVVKVSSVQPVNTNESSTDPTAESTVEGDHLNILFTAGHEATLHVKMHLQFFKAINKGIKGDELIKQHQEIQKPTVNDNQHAAANLGLNESYNDFVDYFIDYAKGHGATNEKIKLMLDYEKQYNTGSEQDLQKDKSSKDVYKSEKTNK